MKNTNKLKLTMKMAMSISLPIIIIMLVRLLLLMMMMIKMMNAVSHRMIKEMTKESKHNKISNLLAVTKDLVTISNTIKKEWKGMIQLTREL